MRQRVDLRLVYPVKPDPILKAAAEADRSDRGESPDVPWWLFPGTLLNILVFMGVLGCIFQGFISNDVEFFGLAGAMMGLNCLFAHIVNKYDDDSLGPM
jgi:hypothetical protein